MRLIALPPLAAPPRAPRVVRSGAAAGHTPAFRPESGTQSDTCLPVPLLARAWNRGQPHCVLLVASLVRYLSPPPPDPLVDADGRWQRWHEHDARHWSAPPAQCGNTPF